MVDCPGCGTNLDGLPDDARYCPSCREPLKMSCRNCGQTLPPEARFCPNCQVVVGDSSTGQGQQRSTSDGPLRLKSREFAHRLEGADLRSDGLLGLTGRKEVEIETGNRALFLENGKLVDELGPGRHTVDSLGQRLKNFGRKTSHTVVLVEEGSTVVDIAIDDIRTASEYPVTVYVEFEFEIDDYEVFVRNLFADRNNVTAETFDQLLGDIIRDELQATLSEYDRDELYGNRDVKQKLQGAIARHCRTTLERNGLGLIKLLSFDYDDDRDEIREGRKQVEIRKEREDIRDDEARLDRRDRERETDDTVHREKQRVRRATAEQSADHEIDVQDIEHDHEKEDIRRDHRQEVELDELGHEHQTEDMQRQYRHRAEREEMDHDRDVMDHERDRTDHEEHKKTTRKEGEVTRRNLEHEQDTKEIEDLMDLKKKKDMDSLDVGEREQGIEMQREEHDVEMERERLRARDEVDLDTVASLEDTDSDVTDLAKMDKAESLSAEQLDALGAQDSDELAKARQEANSAEHVRERLDDQKEFREEVKEMAEGSMDRLQETTESAMDNMGKTGTAAAEDTSDNVIISDTGRSDGGDTTIVQGGGGSGGSESGSPSGDASGGHGHDSDPRTVCPECSEEVSPDHDLCMFCGIDL